MSGIIIYLYVFCGSGKMTKALSRSGLPKTKQNKTQQQQKQVLADF
jgi:hypothetical protein